ncbi:uncharacterized protein [Choristoneura fumiferana]|uniref:uncharacterized protein n=2 Tax=Choristoneura fumiferana TaxID=7141 RepID=UPI003D15DE9D
MTPKSASTLTCNGCSHTIDSRRFLKCSLCNNHFDLICANVSEKRFYNIMSIEHRESWKCKVCREVDNTKSVTTQGSDIAHDIGTRSRSKLNTQSASSPNLAQNTSSAAPAIELLSEMRLLREEVKAARADMLEFRSTISGLSTAVNLCNQRVDDLSERVEAIERQQPANVLPDASIFEEKIASLMQDINDRDQDLLQNDVEVAGVPEGKNESAMHLALSIFIKLGVQLEERDIVSAERAGPLRVAREGGGGAPRPRPLVVRLARRAERDRLLAAARVRRGATTEGITSAVTTFYINERLTKANRILFYKARVEASSRNWKYVWTRDGNIYVRKEHGSPRHRLRSEIDLTKLFGM